VDVSAQKDAISNGIITTKRTAVMLRDETLHDLETPCLVLAAIRMEQEIGRLRDRFRISAFGYGLISKRLSRSRLRA
jgi:hypothetical protein